jgi:ribonucleotide reductase alpha subunit
LGNTEGFEPFTNNIFLRKTLAGEFLVINKFLISELKEQGLWTKDIIDKIKSGGGSIATITQIPEEIRARYKTVWEISQATIIDLAAGRQRFIDQSQSMNLHFSQLSLSKMTTTLFRGWEKGLKTGLYYMRTQAAAKADSNVVTSTSSCCSA